MITSEIINPSPSNWSEYGEQIYSIERDVFADKAFPEDVMESDINDPKAVLVILKDGSAVIGFAYVLPENESAACVVDIAIMEKYQGRGLVAKLMSPLESRLKSDGYEFMIEHAMVDNGYADKIQKNYNERIVEAKDFEGEYGRQRYFRIRL